MGQAVFKNQMTGSLQIKLELYFVEYLINEYLAVEILKVKVKLLSCVQLFVTPWTIAYQVLLSKGFSRQEYWSGLQFPSPGDLPNPGIEPGSASL